jgi:aminotransferase class V
MYLDHSATTPIAPEVLEAMRPYLEDRFGNPSSAHRYGAVAHRAVEGARAQVAALLGCEQDSIVFTASGSESDNLAIKGVALGLLGEGDHIITSTIEHPAVLGACRYLERRLGYRLTILPVDGFGMVDPEDVRRAMEPGTVLVSVMHANNEVGTLEPIADIAGVAREYRIVCHTDAAQSVGKVPVDVDELDVDLLTVTGHKLYAPKGIGALYVRPGTRLDSLIHGAGHEHGLRAGTENVPYIVGLGAAYALAAERLRARRSLLKGGAGCVGCPRVRRCSVSSTNVTPPDRAPCFLIPDHACDSSPEPRDARQREAPAAAAASAKTSSARATARSGAWRASRARASCPSLAAMAALEAPRAAAGSHGACRVCAERLAASAPRASRGTIPRGASLLGVPGSLSTTISPAAAASTSRLIRGWRNIEGREGSERATTVATPSWERRPVAAPRITLLIEPVDNVFTA